MLESKKRHCCSTESVLFHDGKPCGKLKHRIWTTAQIEVHLLEQQRARLKRIGWLPRFRFELVDDQSGEQYAWIKRSYKAAYLWDISLSIGLCRIFTSDSPNKNLFVKQDGENVAEVIETKRNCWLVKPFTEMTLMDQVMIGICRARIVSSAMGAAG
ncbi:MAG: hypothetical protein AAGI37_11685 [Planctomycetota bacterium]